MPYKRHNRGVVTTPLLRSQLSAELVTLCEAIADERVLAPAEVEALRAWLKRSAGIDLPETQHLRNVISRVIVGGHMTRQECRDIFRALQPALAPEVQIAGCCGATSCGTDDAPDDTAQQDPAARRTRTLVMALIAAAAIISIVLASDLSAVAQ